MAKKDTRKKDGGAKGGAVDKRKPKHSGDANRPSKSTNGQRDASTVGSQTLQLPPCHEHERDDLC